MKYYLLSKALRLDRFFQSLEEIEDYIWAKTGIQFFSVDFVKEYLQGNVHYSYQYRGIDIAIFKRSVQQPTSQKHLNDPGNFTLEEE